MDKNDLSLLWCKQYIDKRLKVIGNVDTTIKPGSVGTAELADGSVTADKLADGSVTADKLADGSVTADKLADGSVTLGKLAQEVLELFYQPGSLYINANDINPNELFGFGEWVRIKDRFILAAGDTYAAGSTGGEAEVTLSVDEMPKHGHKVVIWNQNNTTYDAYAVNSAGTGLEKVSNGAKLGSASWQNAAFKTVGNNDLGVGHIAGTTGVGDPSGSTYFVGGDAAHNNMPPYLVVYVWQRVS